jgi:acyl-CoA hydrolase
MRLVDDAGLVTRLLALRDGEPRVVVAGNFATPHRLLDVIDGTLPSYRLFALNAQSGMPEREGVTHETPFVGPGVRRSPRLDYLPARLSLVPRLFATTHPPDVVLLHTTPPRAGRVSLGVEVNILPAAIEQVRKRGGLVVAQVNRQMPWTYGDGEISTDLVDLGLEVDEPLPSPPPATPGDVHRAIGERVAPLVVDGATLQLGIGGVPDATLAGLLARRGLRIWTEMFSDGVLDLEKAGALDVDEELVASFVFGSPELYAWVDGNPRVRMLRTEVTNDPGVIARHPRMTSVNGALQVDLYGQANASWVGGRIYSGFGGQSDFVVGALHAADGLAIAALPSWHPKADRSTIVATLDGPATSFQHSYVVTEQGTATVWPGTSRDQARHLIAVAHPDARAALECAARERGLQ